MAPSHFRHIQPLPQRHEHHYLDVRAEKPPQDGSALAASALFLAIPWGPTGGAVAPVMLTSGRGRVPLQVPLIKATGSGITSLSFCPVDDYVLSTACEDGIIKLWRLPEEGLEQDMADATATLQGHRRKVVSSIFHPAVAQAVASASADRTVRLWDGEQGAQVGLTELEGDASSLSWIQDGSALAACCKAKSVVWMMDPRAKGVVGEASTTKATRIVGLDTERFFTTGATKFSERQMQVFDVRKLDKPQFKMTLDSSTGILEPFYDPDMRMVFLAGRGDSRIRLFDVQEEKLVELTGGFAGREPHNGVCMVPKRGLNLMNCEVARVLRLTKRSVETVGFHVPRKSKKEFHQDLYPESGDGKPQGSIAEWLKGEDFVQHRVTVDPVHFQPPKPAALIAREKEEAERKAKEEQERKIAEAEAEKKRREELLQPSAATLKARSIVRVTKYRHLVPKFATRKEELFQPLDVSIQKVPESNLIAASRSFIAVPWTGAGGSAAVLRLDQPGRIKKARDVPLVFGHTAPVSAATFSPFDDNLLATSSEDTTIKIWRIPEEGLTVSTDKPMANLKGHMAPARVCMFHPTAADLLITGSLDFTVKLWDLRSASVAVNMATTHPEQVQGIVFSYNGSRIVTSCKDKSVRLLDARTGKASDECQAHEGVKAIRPLWLGNTELVLTTGSDKQGGRELKVWDVRRFTEPVSVQVLDQGSGILMPFYDEGTSVLYVAGKGDGNIRTFEITNEPPHLFALADAPSPIPAAGMCMLPTDACDVRACVVARFLKLTKESIIPVTFTVPRVRKEFFQDDVYDKARSMEPALSASEWLSGENKDPLLESLRPDGMELLSTAPPEESKRNSHLFEQHLQEKSAKEIEDEAVSAFYGKMERLREEEDEPLPGEDKEGVDSEEWSD